MELIKNVFFKRIVIYLCCTLLFTSSLFMSYQVPAYAEITYADLLEDALYIAGAAAGIYFSGGTLTPTLLVPFVERLAGTGFDIYDYVTQDEEAGTTTISADFVNLVLQAYKQYQQENGDKFDGTLDYDDTTKIYKYGSSDYHLKSPTVTFSSVMSGCESYYPIAVLLVAGTTQYNYNDWGYGYNPNDTTEGYGYFVFYYVGTPDTSNYGIIPLSRNPNTLYKKPSCIMYADGVEEDRGEGFLGRKISGPGENAPGYFISFNSSTIPVYTSFDMMKDAFHSGDYSHAENYSVGTSSGETSSYTGEYSGGDITVLTSSLDALRDKIAELEASNKSLEEKLKELLEWLKLTGGGSGGGGGGDVTVNVDLSTTNGWLSKIYKKVSQIFDTISGTVNTKLQETLDEILDTLKSIRRWTIADTVFDGLDALADIASFLKDFLTAPAAAIGTAASSLGDAADMLTDRFPFSIPWDMAALVTLLSAEPQAPVFKLPIVIESYGIEEYIEIDMSQYEYLSTIMRGMLSIIYAYGILSMTTKVIDTGGKK